MKASSILERFPQLFAGLAALSLSLVMSSFIFAQALKEFKQANDVLMVTGSAKKPILSDYIILRFSVSSQEPTAQAGVKLAKILLAKVIKKKANVISNRMTSTTTL